MTLGQWLGSWLGGWLGTQGEADPNAMYGSAVIRVTATGSLANGASQPEALVLPGAAHLFRPIRSVTVPEVRAEASSRVRMALPSADDNRASAQALPIGVRGRVEATVRAPFSGAVAPARFVFASGNVRVSRPRGASEAPRVNSASRCRYSVPVASGASTAPRVAASGNAYTSYWTPTTVQNPTAEQIAMLLM